MLVYPKDCCKNQADVFKALGHPIRLWIVKQLADGAEHCVCEFVDAVGVRFATVSQHLAVLKNAGVISAEKRGKQVFYRLTCPCIIKTIDCLGQQLPEDGCITR